MQSTPQAGNSFEFSGLTPTPRRVVSVPRDALIKGIFCEICGGVFDRQIVATPISERSFRCENCTRIRTLEKRFVSSEYASSLEKQLRLQAEEICILKARLDAFMASKSTIREIQVVGASTQTESVTDNSCISLKDNVAQR